MACYLNHLYFLAEEEYNHFRSNWEWFVSGEKTMDKNIAGQAALDRIHQN